MHLSSRQLADAVAREPVVAAVFEISRLDPLRESALAAGDAHGQPSAPGPAAFDAA